MMSAKGFLEDGRMTAAQLFAVIQAVKEAVGEYVDQREVEPDIAAVAIRVAAEALAAYPPDRSCHTCDHLNHDNHCGHWDDTVPEVPREAGCDAHREEGHDAPF